MGLGDGQLLQDYENTKVLVSDINFILSEKVFIVQQIRQELGDFDYNDSPNAGEQATEFRPLKELDNRARYEGEW